MPEIYSAAERSYHLAIYFPELLRLLVFRRAVPEDTNREWKGTLKVLIFSKVQFITRCAMKLSQVFHFLFIFHSFSDITRRFVLDILRAERNKRRIKLFNILYLLSFLPSFKTNLSLCTKKNNFAFFFLSPLMFPWHSPTNAVTFDTQSFTFYYVPRVFSSLARLLSCFYTYE